MQDDFCSAARFHPAKPKPGFPPRQARTTPVRGPRALRGAAFLARRVGTNKDFVKSAAEELLQADVFFLTLGRTNGRLNHFPPSEDKQ
jgi:hypothetical protein